MDKEDILKGNKAKKPKKDKFKKQKSKLERMFRKEHKEQANNIKVSINNPYSLGFKFAFGLITGIITFLIIISILCFLLFNKSFFSITKNLTSLFL